MDPRALQGPASAAMRPSTLGTRRGWRRLRRDLAAPRILWAKKYFILELLSYWCFDDIWFGNFIKHYFEFSNLSPWIPSGRKKKSQGEDAATVWKSIQNMIVHLALFCWKASVWVACVPFIETCELPRIKPRRSSKWSGEKINGRLPGQRDKHLNTGWSRFSRICRPSCCGCKSAKSE